MRLLLLFIFAALPLLAGAHEGHRAPPTPDGVPALGAEQAAPHSTFATFAVAPSRCPGGGHEACCCHDFTGTPSYQPVGIADPGRTELTPLPVHAKPSRRAQSAPRSIALACYSPRGPPPYS